VDTTAQPFCLRALSERVRPLMCHAAAHVHTYRLECSPQKRMRFAGAASAAVCHPQQAGAARMQWRPGTSQPMTVVLPCQHAHSGKYICCHAGHAAGDRQGRARLRDPAAAVCVRQRGARLCSLAAGGLCQSRRVLLLRHPGPHGELKDPTRHPAHSTHTHIPFASWRPEHTHTWVCFPAWVVPA
jgi:hypothetical protein